MENVFLRVDDIEKQSHKAVIGGLTQGNTPDALSAASALAAAASQRGLSIKQYLDASIKVEDEHKTKGLKTGYEVALYELNLPVRDDFANNVSLQAAADTFATQPATRLLFPEVVTDMIKWKQGELDQFVSVAPLIAQTRIVQGSNELIMMELDENGADLSMNTIAEGANIPVVNIAQSQKSVKFYKVGKGYRFTYEFNRRASIDILTPFVNRMNRQFEIDKVNHAVNVLINGDGVASAVTVDAETAYGGTNGTLDWKSFLKWVVARMAAGYPLDTYVMNYATYADFITNLFQPTAAGTPLLTEVGARAGVSVGNTVLQQLRMSLAFGPNVAASNILGINKAETLEELQEAGSDIVENQRVIRSQQVEFFRTINLGYNLVGPNSRRGFSYAS